jgi:hypothetical protein
MIAHVHGGQLNSSDLGAGLGVSSPTVARYLDVLEGTFMIRRLAPYWANVGKRLTKAPKVYVRDTGLLHALLSIPSRDALLYHPKVGASWEGWVIEQAVTALGLAGEPVQPYYWRTHGGAEVDLLLEVRGRLVPIEIKLGGVPGRSRGLVECMKDLKLSRGFVIHGGEDAYALAPEVRALPARLLAHPDALREELLGRPKRRGVR